MMLLGPLAVPGAAQQSIAKPNTVTVTPFLSGSFGTEDNLTGSMGFGLSVGYDWTRNLGFEFDFGHVLDVANETDNVDWSLTNFGGSVLYHFDAPLVTPYAVFGIGWERSAPDVEETHPAALWRFRDSSTEFAWNLGGGVKYRLNDRLLARGDLRRFQANDFAPDHWRLYAGLTFLVTR